MIDPITIHARTMLEQDAADAERDDPLGAAQGILNAIALTLALAIIGGLVWSVLS